MKYYVSSGDLQVVIERESREFAALDVLDAFGGYDSTHEVDGVVRVNETGFEPKSSDTIFSTSELLMEISGESGDENS